jgi:hypothetical protein
MSHTKFAKRTALCPAPGCDRVGDWARGFCNKHYCQLRNACIKNGSWPGSRNGKLPKPQPPKFEYEGDEAALIEMTEQREQKSAERPHD